MVNVLGGVSRGIANAAAANQVRDRNAIRDLYAEQGAGIAAGDQNALNALSALDPMAALGVQDQRQAMGIRAEQNSRARQRFDLELAQYASGLSEQQAAQEAAQMESAIVQGIGLYQSGDLPGLNAFLGQNGIEPLASLDMFPALAATAGDALGKLKEVAEFGAGPKPLSGPGKIAADIDAGILPQGTPLQSPGVVVNTGDTGPRPIADKPPKGFQRVWDSERQTYVDRPIPGSEAENERGAEMRSAELAVANYNRKSDIVNTNLDEAISMLDRYGRGVAGFGSWLSVIPETAAKDFQSRIDTVKANLGFDELQAMRDASPTGGALGQVSEREIDFLQSIQGNLDTAQSPEQLMAILMEIKTRMAGFRSERERIMAQNFTAKQAGELSQRGRDIPDFGAMSDEQLDAWIAENGQ